MKSHLLTIEHEARNLRKAGKLKEAAELFSSIIREEPNWEHGEAFYELACCYEDIGQLNSAEECYQKALSINAKNPYFLGGYASFLYLHRDPNVAFAAYVELLQVESRNKNENAVKTVMIALRALGGRIGLSDQTISDKITRAINSEQ